MRIAIVGAGISGLSCAHELHATGHQVTVVDKSRGPSGRMSTRRHELGSFDHGAQYFTVRDRNFSRVVAKWEAAGTVAKWGASFGQLGPQGWQPEAPSKLRFVGTPSMSAICRAMSVGLDLQLGARVVGLRRLQAGWRMELVDGSHLGPFDAIVLSCPAPQAAVLLADRGRLGPMGRGTQLGPAGLAAAAVGYQGTWALMLGFDRPIQAPFDGMDFSREGSGASTLAWAARDSSKPGRSPGERWVVHASSPWSDAHMEDQSSTVVAAMVEAFSRHVDIGPANTTFAAAHRWRYARTTPPPGQAQPWSWDPQRGLGLCGDGLTHARVESAWASGVGLGRQIVEAAIDAEPSLRPRREAEQSASASHR